MSTKAPYAATPVIVPSYESPTTSWSSGVASFLLLRFGFSSCGFGGFYDGRLLGGLGGVLDVRGRHRRVGLGSTDVLADRADRRGELQGRGGTRAEREGNNNSLHLACCEVWLRRQRC